MTASVQVAEELSGALQRTQYGLKACVENLCRRLDIADHQSVRRLPPSTLGRCVIRPTLTRPSESSSICAARGTGQTRPFNFLELESASEA